MSTDNDEQRSTERERIVEAVASWPDITTGDGRFGSTSFQLAGREIGHLHPRLADIDYPKPLRDQLLADGKTEEHHAVPEHPTATTFHIESVDDVDQTVWLFRLSYLVHLAILQKRNEAAKRSDIDVRKEVNELEPTDSIRSAFEAAVADGFGSHG
ncbi:luciferase domain-containing protein [Natronorubrum halophilum]|uniref:luciferase domain-containing protein n=1 Tax=Natronorubrum halophilum TaxID=1702106 RepID=UPI0010C15F69|nr:luciferase family protein [Natronorubrum halophilum]